MAGNALIEAASALCALAGVTPKKMVAVSRETVIIQSGRDRYHRLAYNGLWSRWEFGSASMVSIAEMNALAASGALDNLLTPPAPQQAIGATSEKRQKWFG